MVEKTAPKKIISKPVSLKNITVEDTFWKEEMELVRKEVILCQWDILNDCVEGAASSFCMRNFKVAGKITKEKKNRGIHMKKLSIHIRALKSYQRI